MDVGDDLPPVAACGQELSGKAVERAGLGPGHLDGAVQWRGERDFGQRGGDVIRCDRLDESGRQADHIALSPRLDDAVDELEELCRAEDRIGDAGGLDQLLLGHLRPKVAALEKALRADDRSEEHTSELQSLMRTSYAVF